MERGIKTKIIRASALLLVFAAFLTAQAQSELLPEPSAFFIELAPSDSPGPKENITASLSGFSFDLNRANITWVKNGRVETKGLGLVRYDFRTGEAGEKISLQVVATDANGVRHDAGIAFTVAGVDLLWRADTYAPAWDFREKMPPPRAGATARAPPP